MKNLAQLFKQNKAWADKILKNKPDFFKILSKQQSPEYLWIGCSDSRVPANDIVGLLPGELFVHRNVANLVKHVDMNCLSVMQYAIDVLKIKHIIVCGHYGCGGVKAAMEDKAHGLVDNWIRVIRDTYLKNKGIFSKLKSEEAKINKLCELNVINQVYNACQTTIVQEAWKRKQDLTIHGWIYSLDNGLLKDLKVSNSKNHKLPQAQADIF